MPDTDQAVTPRDCSIARTLELIGEKWALLALREILSARLRKLVASGVLERQQYQERPARFEYRLTQPGRELLPVLLTLMQWGDRYLSHGDPPLTYRHRCGADLESVLICGSCGEPVTRRDLTPVATRQEARPHPSRVPAA